MILEVRLWINFCSCLLRLFTFALERCLEQVEVFRSKARWKKRKTFDAFVNFAHLNLFFSLPGKIHWITWVAFRDWQTIRRNETVLNWVLRWSRQPTAFLYIRTRGKAKESDLLGHRWPALSFPLQGRETRRFAKGANGESEKLNEVEWSRGKSILGVIWPLP